MLAHYIVRKHSTWIGDFSNSRILSKHSTQIGDFSEKLPIHVECLRTIQCASILRGLVTFRVAKNYFNVFPHGLVTFQKVTNLSGMLAHSNIYLPKNLSYIYDVLCAKKISKVYYFLLLSVLIFLQTFFCLYYKLFRQLGYYFRQNNTNTISYLQKKDSGYVL